jgi:hypothetical protein
LIEIIHAAPGDDDAGGARDVLSRDRALLSSFLRLRKV